MTSSTPNLTKYPSASIREIAILTLSYMLIFFSGSLMGLCDRLFLAKFSLNAFEASVSAFYLVQLFQLSTIRTVSVAQTYIAQYKGANRDLEIGAIIWQMIWLSLFLIFFVIPVSYPISQVFFRNSPIESEGLSYFRTFIGGNFLFTIGSALSCFYLGQGKTKKILYATLFSQILNFLLDFPFIFGVNGWMAPMGAQGAALASVIAEFFFCVILLGDFLQKKNRLLFGTGEFVLKKSLFSRAAKLGGSRGFSVFIILSGWGLINYMIVQKPEPEYLAVLTFGGSLILFSNCFNEGFSRAITTIGAYTIGAKKNLIWKIACSSIYFLLIICVLIFIPCFIFRDQLINLFFKEEISIFLKQQLYLSFYWSCLYFLMFELNAIGLGLVLAYGDVKFHMILVFINTWIIGAFSVYFGIVIYHLPPYTLWLLMAFCCLQTSLAYFLRLRQEKWKTISIISEKPLIEET